MLHGVDTSDLTNAWAVIVYLAGKDLTTLRPLSLLDKATDKLVQIPPGETFQLLDRQPLHRRPAWRRLELDDPVHLQYKCRPVVLTIESFRNAFCITQDDDCL